MSKTEKGARILDDMARIAGGAVNVASGLQQQIKNDVKSRVEMMATQLDLVPREDFDNAMLMIDSLTKRLDAVEAELAALKGKGKK